MSSSPFRSALARYLNDFVAFRRSVGFVYGTQVSVLRRFDRIAEQELAGAGPVTQKLVEAYLCSLGQLRPLTRRIQLSTVRQFLIYLQRIEPDTFIPDRALLPGGAPRPPRIYTEDEIHSLMREALLYPLRYPRRRWLLYHTLLGLLHVTGMRISEVLALTLGDLDRKEQVLRIRKTKFHKSRLVPLRASSLAAIERYLVARARRGHRTSPDAPFFVGNHGGPLPYSTARQAFARIAQMAGLYATPGARRPRLHDFRHTAAVRRLSLWYRDGEDVQTLLPALVTYLGHSAVRCTEVYLTTTSELLSEANARFEASFPLDGASQGGPNHESREPEPGSLRPDLLRGPPDGSA